MENNLLSKQFFKSGSAWIILLVGIFFYYLGYFTTEPNTVWKEILIKIGDILVIGVIIGYLTNVAQLLGIFKSDLEEVIYGKEFLCKRTDIHTIWERVSKELFKSKFPAISKDLLNIIKETYLPLEAKQISYYNDYNVNISIDWADDKKDFIIVKSTVNFDLLAEDMSNFDFPVKSWINVEGLTEDQFYVKINEYTVNNKPAANVRETRSISGTHLSIHILFHLVALLNMILLRK